MQRVIVTVKRQNEARVRDLEVPADLPAEQLAATIARALNWDANLSGALTQYRIEAHLPGKAGAILQPDETLASAGVWDGAWLVFVPPGAAAAAAVREPAQQPAPASPRAAPAGPVAGWRSLGIDVPNPANAGGEATEPPQPGFEWKQLD